jgi:hypothetical protein
MADLVYDRTRGELSAFGQTWKAVSGGGRHRPLARKTYTIPAGALMVGTRHTVGAFHNRKYSAAPFTDPAGLGWYLWLGEAGLGIHPDGNVPGTEGCVGVKGNTETLFELLRQHSRDVLTLEVRD